MSAENIKKPEISGMGKDDGKAGRPCFIGAESVLLGGSSQNIVGKW
jgi:hypothetical protein